jgi:hypothetical protein
MFLLLVLLLAIPPFLVFLSLGRLLDTDPPRLWPAPLFVSVARVGCTSIEAQSQTGACTESLHRS